MARSRLSREPGQGPFAWVSATRTRPAGWRPPGARQLLATYWVHVPVTAAIIFFFVRFALLGVQVQDAYAAPGFDIGIFDQGVWLLSRFHAPFVTVMGRNLFGDHTSFVLLLAVPLYWIWPRAQTLIVLQAALLAAAAVPVYLVGLRLLKKVPLATALTLAYLLNPALQRGDIEAAGPFHPESFLVFFLALAIYAAVEWRPRLLIAASIGCLLVKEDSALLVVPLAVWVAFRRDRRTGTALGVSAVLYAVFAYEVVIRLLLGTTAFYSNRIPFGGLSGLIAAPFAHPGRFWSYLKSGYRPFYLWQVGASLGWAFLVAPELAAVAILYLAENTLSNFPYMQQIQYHYSLALVPVLAMGTIYAVSRLRNPTLRTGAAGYVLCTAVLACYMWGLAPFSRHATYPHSPPNSLAVREVNRALRSVPADAVISAYYPYVSHLDHRVYCYEWPNPFRAEYWGLYDREGQVLPFAGRVQYLVVPAELSGDDQTVFERIAPQFRLVTTGGGVDVYRRVAPAAVAGAGPPPGPGSSGSG